ncbi:MAG: DUF1552 domain-containing protein [Cytophagales bacterium]|nr:DUF1552 domain-containing protein [Armatimonadota bacterium]
MSEHRELLTGQKMARRTLLRGAGALMALPLLEAMLPVTALARSIGGGAAAQAVPKRLAFLFVPNGVHMPAWTPAAPGALTTLPATLQPLAAFKDSLLVMSGLTQRNAFALGDGGGDHARSAATWLTGCHPRKTSGADIKAGPSADQVAARYIGRQTRFPTLELGVERGGLAGDCDSGYSCAYSSTISWRTENTPVAKETSPRAIFDRLFGSGSDDGLSSEESARRRSEQGSILDAVQEEAGSLQRQLGSHDRQKLDEYLTSVREIEQRVQFTERSAKSDWKTKLNLTPPPVRPSDMAEHIRLMGDMMVLAFQTDQTRIATFMFANEGSNRSYKPLGILEGHHELSHHGGSQEKQEKIQQINQYHVQQLAYILQRMSEVEEANGSLLDNTMLVYGGGISDGDRHNHNNLPILVAGGKGMFQTGRHVIYPDNTPLTNLFLTAFDRMGLPTDRIGTIGDSSGRLTQLF